MRFDFVEKSFVELDVDKDKLAVAGSDVDLTWSEFQEKVDELCAILTDLCKGEEGRLVLVYGHKSAFMLVAFYALMKLEIPYVPVDEIYPSGRIEKIRDQSKSRLLINTVNKDVPIEMEKVLNLKNGDYQIIQENTSTEEYPRMTDPLVYTIFTSGSTGEPKGVQISTEAIQSFTRWMTKDFGFTSEDIFLNTAILSFDLSVFEVMTYGALGASLVLCDKKTTSDPALLLDRVQHYKATIWVSTPSFALIYSGIDHKGQCDSIKSFLFCGEILPNNTVRNLMKNYYASRIFNTYGPTEATVATTIVEITKEIMDEFDPLPVGRSKMESELIIEDDEIIITGPNVSVGYVSNEELNQAKFFLHEGKRAFRTGDQGYLEDGMLFFKGRNDDLVKLHGYRIELTEISNVIRSIEGVLHCETIPLSRNNMVKKIVSLVQLKQGFENTINRDQIESVVLENLPDYMLPGDIRFIDEFPLNQNGKADKNRLMEIYLGK